MTGMDSAHRVRSIEPRAAPRRVARATRWLGTTLVVVGIGMLGWSLAVWKWEDPFTSLYTAYEQRQLDSQLATLTRDRAALPPPPADEPRAVTVSRVRAQAKRFRSAAEPGTAIGRLRVPRLGVNMVMVEGTDSDSLKKGPGRDGRTFMPGEGKLVYIAGHRTTYSAPLAKIDALRQGDRVTVEMPYGTFVYAVSRHRIVDDQDLSVLRTGPREELALQACHPRFFATQRYIVWARPVAMKPRGGTATRFADPSP